MSVDATCVFAQIAVAAYLLASNRAHYGFMSFVKVGVLLLFPFYE